MRAILLSTLLVLTACGGGGSGDPSTTAGGGTPGVGGSTTGSLCDGTASVTGCQMAWTGAATGHAQCYPSYSPGTVTGLSMSTTTVPTAYANLTFATPPAVGTYVLTDLKSGRGGLLPIAYGDPNYLMSWDGASSYGELSLTIASFDGSGNPHGHLRLVAPEISITSNKVELCAQF